ncbi:hypothetical protein DB32_006749 [Sandaracinus amylolyticus]|uniref:Uncharacterized protein n=1 Tax=Sandaracinus amylolyticus TaxID=927083 RepID=A0A0F6W7P0_9BACT|nr:hypothetical protein DB32_006749 [Sandaracinus amylolyticus]
MAPPDPPPHARYRVSAASRGEVAMARDRSALRRGPGARA